jgi:hypothetical protein
MKCESPNKVSVQIRAKNIAENIRNYLKNKLTFNFQQAKNLFYRPLKNIYSFLNSYFQLAYNSSISEPNTIFLFSIQK